jgi:hypothetical protein
LTDAAITDVLDIRLLVWASLTGLIAGQIEELGHAEALLGERDV